VTSTVPFRWGISVDPSRQPAGDPTGRRPSVDLSAKRCAARQGGDALTTDRLPREGETVVVLPDGRPVPTRVVISPYASMVAAIFEIFAYPELPRGSPKSWHRHVHEQTRSVDLTPLDAYSERIFPDFLWDVGDPPRRVVEEQLDDLRATSPSRVAADIEREVANWGGEVPPAYRPYLADPQATLARLADTLQAFWNAVFAPLWSPAMEPLLEREVLRLGAALATDGPPALLARLSHRLRYDEGGLRFVAIRPEGTVEIGDRRLVVMPMVCGPDVLLTSIARPHEVVVAYAASGVGVFWELVDIRPAAPLADVLGQTRARVLAAVETPGTTADVAQQLQLTTSLVSHHLKALERASLVDGARFGRRVYYRQTTKGRQLCQALQG
jgi:DNA-binding transcriptional ArsR family regulator